MTRLNGLPFGVPGTGTSGLNAKESTAGCSVLLRKLTRPNIKPSTAPYFGPSSRQPTITGTYNVVALISPSGTMPRGVKPRTKMMAVKQRQQDEITVLCGRFAHIKNLLLLFPKDTAQISHLL